MLAHAKRICGHFIPNDFLFQNNAAVPSNRTANVIAGEAVRDKASNPIARPVESKHVFLLQRIPRFGREHE